MPALVNCPATTGPKSQAAPGFATLTLPEAGVAAEALLPASRRADRDEATDAARFIGNAPFLECEKLGMIRCKSTGAMAVLERLRAETRAEHLAIEAALDLAREELAASRYRLILERLYGCICRWKATSPTGRGGGFRESSRFGQHPLRHGRYLD